jgi:hypothetical protein
MDMTWSLGLIAQSDYLSIILFQTFVRKDTKGI